MESTWNNRQKVWKLEWSAGEDQKDIFQQAAESDYLAAKIWSILTVLRSVLLCFLGVWVQVDLSIVIIFSEVQCITDWNSEYTVRDITVKETRTLQLWDNPVFPYGSLRSIVVVQSLSHVWLFVIPWTAAYQASLPFIVSQSLLRFMSIVSVMPSNHLFLCCPLLFPSIFSSIGVFSNESALHIKWSKYWSFSFSIRLSSEYSGLISFGIGWFDLLVVQGTFKSLLWHHNLKNINSLVLSLFYDPTLTSVHDYWKNHSFD